MTIFQAIGISVTSSFIVLALIGVTRMLWWRGVEKFYLKLTCLHTPDVSGRWHAHYEDPSGHACSETIDIKQFGYRIEGQQEYQIAYTSTPEPKSKNFEFSGILRNDLLTALLLECCP
ncbi:MAG: hypothetical protein H8E66_33395 [Planctomycetes bacterium]|nr:hypothetical protein [Planctomycetota bacterium]